MLESVGRDLALEATLVESLGRLVCEGALIEVIDVHKEASAPPPTCGVCSTVFTRFVLCVLVGHRFAEPRCWGNPCVVGVTTWRGP